MAVLIIKTYMLAPETLIPDMGINVPAGGGSVTLTFKDELEEAQDSRDLLTLATNHAYGPTISTLILNNGTSDIAEADIPAYLLTMAFNVTGAFSLPVRDVDGEDTNLFTFAPTNFTPTANTANGYMEGLNTSLAPIPQLVTVSLGAVGADFASVKDACDSITDASTIKPYIVEVGPGVYTESPFTIPAFVCVRGKGLWLETILQTNDDLNHFITLSAAATLTQVSLTGPTGGGYAAVDYTAAGTMPGFLSQVVIRKGYYGVYVHPATAGTIHCHEVVNRYSGTTMEDFFHIENGVAILLGCSFMSGPPSAVGHGFHATGTGSELTLDTCAFRNGGTSIGLSVSDGAHVRLTGTTITTAAIGIHVEAIGVGVSEIRAAGCVIDPNGVPIAIQTDTPNCLVLYTGSLSVGTTAFTPGTPAIINATDANGFTVLGELWLGASSTGLFPLTTFAHAFRSTGVDYGGEVSKDVDFDVTVFAGGAFLENPPGVIAYHTWIDTTVTLPASTEPIWIGVNGSGTVTYVTSEPDPDTFLVLADASTNATMTVILASRHPELPQQANAAQNYARDVVGPINVSGCIATKHGSAPSLQLAVDSGSYYIYNVRKNPTASAPILICLCYRNGSGGWNHVMDQTAVDGLNYDDGSGTLAPLPTGKWRRDLLFITTHGGGSDYHYVLGQQVWDTEAEATRNPIPPDTLLVNGMRIASLVLQEGTNDITTIIDQRPRLGQLSTGSAAVTRHGDLTGLSANDHPQYQLVTGKGAVSGYAGLDGAAKVPSAQLPLTSTPPVAVTKAGAAVGVSGEIARADHKHDITTAAATAIGGANTEGVATSLARSDHNHKLRTTEGGGTDLTIGSVADGQTLRRTGTVIVGTESFTSVDHAALRQLIHFIDDGPAEGFASGSYREILPVGDPFPTSKIWYTASDKLHKIVEKLITRLVNQRPDTIIWKVYSTSDVLLATVTDTYDYSGGNFLTPHITRTII